MFKIHKCCCALVGNFFLLQQFVEFFPVPAIRWVPPTLYFHQLSSQSLRLASGLGQVLCSYIAFRIDRSRGGDLEFVAHASVFQLGNDVLLPKKSSAQNLKHDVSTRRPSSRLSGDALGCAATPAACRGTPGGPRLSRRCSYGRAERCLNQNRNLTSSFSNAFKEPQKQTLQDLCH